ncbi:MAG: ribokinase [Clostridia bacterium]|nr:ribokinase [Clostridia bacterium]
MDRKVRIIGPGSSNCDLTGFAPHLPVAGETVMGSALHVGPGGKGANQMTAAARAGGEAVFITRIGRDVFGETLDRHFDAEGFNKTYITSPEGEVTGTALIEIDESDAQNRIIVIPGANQHITPADVDAADADFAASDAVMAQLEITLSAVVRAKELAQKYHKPFILNPAPYHPLDSDFLNGIDWFTPNETEAGYFTGMVVCDVDSAREAAKRLLAVGVKNVVITLGVNGAYWTDGVSEVHVPGIRVKAVETTGAGDTFNGALAVAIAEGLAPVQALRFANAAAAISVTRLGAAASTPYRDEILALVREQYGE